MKKHIGISVLVCALLLSMVLSITASAKKPEKPDKPRDYWGTYSFEGDLSSAGIAFYTEKTKPYTIIVGEGTLTFSDAFGDFSGDHTGEIEVEMCQDPWAMLTFTWEEGGSQYSLQGKLDYEGDYSHYWSFDEYRLRQKRPPRGLWRGNPVFHMWRAD
jgi:hypothetical protein